MSSFGSGAASGRGPSGPYPPLQHPTLGALPAALRSNPALRSAEGASRCAASSLRCAELLLCSAIREQNFSPLLAGITDVREQSSRRRVVVVFSVWFGFFFGSEVFRSVSPILTASCPDGSRLPQGKLRTEFCRAV